MFLGGVAVLGGIMFILISLPLIWTPAGWLAFALGVIFIWGGSTAF